MDSTPSASHSMTEERFCPYCEKTTQVHVVTNPETLPVRGEPVDYIARLYRCDTCNQDFASQSQEEDNFEMAYEIYRKRHNLLSPMQIRDIRKKYDLSQANMALLLGWGEITIHRYENGSLQDTAHNELLVLLDNPQNARKILNLNKANLPEDLARKLAERIELLITKNRDQCESWFNLFDDEWVSLADVNTGYKRFDLAKFENLILYLLHNCKEVYKTKLNKLLWYCDFRRFQLETVSLTGARYVHLPFGPVPDNYEFFLWKLQSEKKIRSIEKVFASCAGEILVPLAKVNPRTLTASELTTVDEVVRKLGALGAKALSDKSHKERAYVETGEMEAIPYTYAVDLNM
jgi:putative zinc finger/helix-turn-helix YgiT family protein